MFKTLGRFLAIIILFPLSTWLASAQTAPIITNNTEYDIGTGCPEAQTLSLDGETLWVLLSDCARISGGGVALTAYSAEDGALAAEPIPVYFHDATQASYIDHFTNPLGLTVDGHFSIRYNDSETYAPQSTTIVADGSDAPASVIDDAALAELLLSVSDYPEGAIYSHDHTRVAITGDTAMTVFDLTTGETLFSLPVEEETYNAFPSFSPDGRTVYVAAMDNYSDMDDYSTTVSAYDLSDGTLKGSFAAPSFIVWVSPDGKYAAVETGSNDGTVSELVVVDTETDAVSEPFSLYEPPRRVTACTNDGRNVSDVDFTASGTLALIGVNWLPDSSGFVITRSYGGEGAFGGSICTFDTSRLNVITVGGG